MNLTTLTLSGDLVTVITQDSETEVTLGNNNEFRNIIASGVTGPSGKDGRDGTNGIDGVDGINGTNGVGGATTAFAMVTTPSQIWTIPHNLNRFPQVTVVDTFGNVLLADVNYIDINIIRVTHGVPLTGTVYYN